jgi:hypothetical protein
MAHAWVHAYYNSFVKRQQKLTDYQSNCNIAMVSYFMCARTLGRVRVLLQEMVLNIPGVVVTEPVGGCRCSSQRAALTCRLASWR